MAEFNAHRQTNFMESIARVAGASPADVTIRSIKDISSARRSLLSSSILVDTSVKAEDKADAVAMSKRLTADSINQELSKVVSLCYFCCYLASIAESACIWKRERGREKARV